MFGLGIQEIIVILILMLILFDHKKIPEVMRGAGRLYREIMSAQQSLKDEILREDIQEELRKTADGEASSKLDSSEPQKEEKDYNESGRAG
ncbi:MAG: Sec-independent protein translocase subunit TatA/TatB [Myxococcota bacterium]